MQHARWLVQARRSVKRIDRWWRRHPLFSPSGAHQRLGYPSFASLITEDLCCDVCGTSQSNVEPRSSSASSHDHSSRGLSSNLPKIEEAECPPATVASTVRNHTRLVKQLLGHLRSHKDDEDSTSLSQQTVGRPMSIARGLWHSSTRQEEDLHAQVAAGQRFPAVDVSPSLLELSSRMAAFSAASYGPAYIEGFFSSMRRNASIGIPGLRMLITPPEEVHRQAARVLLGSTTDHQWMDIVRCRTRESMCEASYSIIVDHLHKNIVVAFRGTTSSGDVVTDLMTKPMLLSALLSELPSSSTTNATTEDGRFIPLGFGRSVQHAIRSIETQLAALEQSLCDYETCFTGHSLGAIQANLYYLVTAHVQANSSTPCRSSARVSKSANGSDRRVVGFAPAPCVSRAIAAEDEEELGMTKNSFPVLNFAYGHDIVPRLQVSSFRHSFDHGDRTKAPSVRCQQQTRIDDDACNVRASGGVPQYYLPGTTVWMDPATLVTPHAQPSPLRRVLHFPQCPDEAKNIREWNCLPSSIKSVEHHFLQWPQRDIAARLAAVR